MEIIVVKSNGDEQEIDYSKIRNSISKAYESVNQPPYKLEEVMDILKLKIEEFLEDNRISTKLI